ncbi:MAG: site-specific integrase [Myxococcales bacterium]|nr:site-specific integrase [Myxococcales bacterium]
MSDTPKIRYLGPYKFRGPWRCQLVEGERRFWLSPEKTPERAIAVAERSLAITVARQPLTIEQALENYRQYKLQVKGNKPSSVITSMHRLRSFFREPGLAVYQLTPHRCAGYYRRLVEKQRPDTHRSTLAEAGTFCRWLMKGHQLKLDPLQGIEPVGRKRKGKPQLRFDEARRWWTVAEAQAQAGEAGAIAAMMTLLMALRASEITTRTVRDRDNGGSLLWIPEAKTEAGKRTVRVPKVLQPYLLELARDKLPGAFLFPGKLGGPPYRAWPRKWVQRLCRQAKVPEVCAHSMRGLHATLAMQQGESPELVARVMGHESPTITLTNYAAPGSAQLATAERAEAALLPN